MPRRASIRAAFAAGVLWALAVGTSPAAGLQECLLNVQTENDSTSYQERDNYCEGTYVALQSAPLNVQVISFTRGRDLSLPAKADSPDSVFHVVAVVPPGRTDSEEVAVLGRTRRANLNWALDASLQKGDTLRWNLKHSVWPRSLKDEVGVFGRVPAQPSAFEDPIFLPVDVVPRQGAPAEATAGDHRLVLKLPGAAELKWRFASSEDSLTTAEPLDMDGYFGLTIPAATTGTSREDTLAVFWRPRGRLELHSVPEFLQIYRD